MEGTKFGGGRRRGKVLERMHGICEDNIGVTEVAKKQVEIVAEILMDAEIVVQILVLSSLHTYIYNYSVLVLFVGGSADCFLSKSTKERIVHTYM